MKTKPIENYNYLILNALSYDRQLEFLSVLKLSISSNRIFFK